MFSRTIPIISLLFACDGSSTDLPLCRSNAGLAGGNGNDLQGSSLQGSNLNGIQIQGSSHQGSDYQGIELQGMESQGVQIQGMETQGIFQNGVTLEGSTFVGKDKRVLELEGAQIHVYTAAGKRIPLTITAMDRDAATDITYYALALPDGTNVCGNSGKGMFVAGVWDEGGRHHDSLGSGDLRRDATYSCTSGVIAKCAGWGYQPWIVGTELHQTCTRMARADYCGDGISHTLNGTLIDLYDVEGIQVPERTLDESFQFEAGWGPNGAVCMHRARYSDRVPSCFSQKPACDSFEDAIEQGALMGNASGTSQSALCAE